MIDVLFMSTKSSVFWANYILIIITALIKWLKCKLAKTHSLCENNLRWICGEPRKSKSSLKSVSLCSNSQRSRSHLTNNLSSTSCKNSLKESTLKFQPATLMILHSCKLRLKVTCRIGSRTTLFRTSVDFLADSAGERPAFIRATTCMSCLCCYLNRQLSPSRS